MVEDRDTLLNVFLTELEKRLKSLLKHEVCRKIKFYKVDVKDNPQEANGLYISTSINVNIPQNNQIFTSFSKVNESDLDNLDVLKNIIRDIKAVIPEEYKSLKITNFNKTIEDLTSNISTDKTVDEFYLTRIPYRQLQIGLFEDKKIFLNLCTKTYNRILNKLNNIDVWPAELNFLEIKDCFKRKELITLLIYLNQASISHEET